MKALHIDGHPCSWFAYKRNGETERVVYASFAWAGDDPAALVRHAHETVAKIEKMSYMNGNDEAPVIFWRRRIECKYNKPATAVGEPSFSTPGGHWRVSFRVAAVPQLTNEQWASLDMHKEGAFVKRLA